MGSRDETHVPLSDALIGSAVPRLVLVPPEEGPDAVPRSEPVLPPAVAVVDAPSALAGFLLVMSMPRWRCRNSQGTDGRWRVSVELRDGDSRSELTEAVERWLRREQITATDVRVGADVHHLTGARG